MAVVVAVVGSAVVVASVVVAAVAVGRAAVVVVVAAAVAVAITRRSTPPIDGILPPSLGLGGLFTQSTMGQTLSLLLVSCPMHAILTVERSHIWGRCDDDCSGH